MMAYTEWIQVQVLLSIVRSATRPDWCPPEITFMSRFVHCSAALVAFGRARILHGQKHTSFTVPLALLAAPLSWGREASVKKDLSKAGACTSEVPSVSFAETIKEAMAAYVESGKATLATAAEIAGLSGRTLQRTLSGCGYSFSALLGEVRFERACDLLADPDIKIIEVACAGGYQNLAHFSRAFRRMTGMTPREFRRFRTDAAGEGLGKRSEWQA
jgi:AraC-like DNA-binding protein